MESTPDIRRIGIFLAFAFGISGATSLIVYFTGGYLTSPVAIPIPGMPGGGISLAILLVATFYMFSPAFAHALTRMISGEGWKDVWIRPQFRRGWVNWLLGFISPIILTIAGAAVFYVLFPQFFDPKMKFVTVTAVQAARQAGQDIPEEAIPSLILLQATVGIVIGTAINSFFTFGEEFGWRAYLLQKLMPLGWQRAVLSLGVIWGVWHWPIIALGHNYGLDYPGAPYLGMLLFVPFTAALGIIFSWLTLRAGSLWPAVIGHASMNAVGGLGFLFVQGEPSPLLGPFPFGLIGMIPFVLVAAWLVVRPGKLPELADSSPQSG